jgi:hypothetical protein
MKTGREDKENDEYIPNCFDDPNNFNKTGLREQGGFSGGQWLAKSKDELGRKLCLFLRLASPFTIPKGLQ